MNRNKMLVISAMTYTLTIFNLSYAKQKINSTTDQRVPKNNKYFFVNEHNNNVYYLKKKLKKLDNQFLLYETSASDTLMLIAFELYSNYDKWREIANDNKSILGSNFRIKPGTFLKIRLPIKLRTVPTGIPYLIKNKDTLGIISNKVYGLHKYWKEIYLNNKDQIKNPNIIFAGFTLYYRAKSKHHIKNKSLSRSH